MGRILLCDDEDSLCRSLGRILRSAGHDVVAVDGPGGYARMRQERFDLILTDIRMPGFNGFEILAAARTHAPGTPVIAMSGSAEIPDAVRAMHAGARDFLIKPFEIKALEEAVANVLKPQPPAVAPPDPIVWRDHNAPWMLGNDPAMLPVFSLLSQVADTRCTVLITGESGTGKELAARSLHAGSSRASKPFVAVNCAAIPPSLVESELFGHVKGAFTGATTSRVGRFAQADRGTIFLDEIGEMETGRAGQAAAPDPGRRALRRSATRPRRRSTCASWRRPTATSSARWRRGASAPTSTGGSTSSRSRCRACARGRPTSRGWPSTS